MVWCWDGIWCLGVVAGVEMVGFVRCERRLWTEVRIIGEMGCCPWDVNNEIMNIEEANDVLA